MVYLPFLHSGQKSQRHQLEQVAEPVVVVVKWDVISLYVVM